MSLSTAFPPQNWPTFDPELAAVPTSTTVLTAAEVAVLGCVFTNTSGAARTVTVTDTAGLAILYLVTVPPSGVSFEKEWPMCRLTGLKWIASGGSVVGKVWGWL